MKLVLGTAQFGMKYGATNLNKIKFDEITRVEKKILKSNKINFIDTAFNYGGSHKIIQRSKLSNLNIITKIKIPNKKPKNLENYIFSKIRSVLIKFKTKSLYGLLIHDYSDIVNNDLIILKILLNLKKKKLVKNVGVSVYSVNNLNEVLKIWTPDIIQIPFNVIDQRFSEKSYLKKLKKKKIKIFCRSCFLQGILLNNKSNVKFSRESKKIIKRFEKWCFINKISKIDACINFIKQEKNIDFLVIGVNSLLQLDEILKSFFSKKIIKITKKIKSNNLKLIDPRKWIYERS